MNNLQLLTEIERGSAIKMYDCEFPELPDCAVYLIGGWYYLFDSEKILYQSPDSNGMTDFILLNRGYKIR